MSKQLVTIIYSNLLPFVFLFIFFIIIFYNAVFNKYQASLFKKAALLTMGMIIVISIDYLLSYQSGEVVIYIRRTTSFLNFAISPFLPFLLYKISHPQKSPKWMYSILVINTILCLISIPTGIIFDISILNAYSRGFLFFVPFLSTVFYIIILIIGSTQQHSQHQRAERLYLAFVIVLLILSMILEIGFGFRFLTWTSSAIALPLYYLLLNVNNAIKDPLTNAFNRLIYAKELEKISSKGNSVIALLDINDFKLINDKHGHEIGDQFLIKLTNIIDKYLPKNSSLYRIGGDEFVIIAKKSTDIDKLSNCINNARKECNLNLIDFSYGIDVFYNQMSISDFLDNIDQLMYKNKKKDKEKRNL